MSDALDPFAGGDGTPVVKFTEVGDKVEGKILKVEYREDRDLDGNVRTFPDGKPRPSVVVHLQTADGVVRDFVNGRSVTTFRNKVWAVEGEGNGPKNGADYKREMTGKKAAQKAGYSPEKLYEISYGGSEDEERELV